LARPRRTQQRPPPIGNISLTPTRNTVEYVYAQTNKPVLVTENGLETEDDERRVWFIGEALSGLLDAIDGGVPVLGYFHWSLIDNFEWVWGFGPKYGLAAVNRETFARTLKPSARVFADIARRGRI